MIYCASWTMNFLNGCIVRYDRLALWYMPYCRDALRTSQLATTDNKQRKIFPNNNTKPILQIKMHIDNICVPYPTMWTQVRYNKEYPRLHRDVEFPNFDAYRKDDYKDVRKTDWGQGDGKPGFTYFIGFFGCLCGVYSAKTELTHFLTFMSAAADVLALASIEVELSKIAPGACASYKWRGKPLFIKNRTQADIDFEANTPVASLRDPQSPEDRTVKPEWLIVIGICTHLGCVPIANTGDYPGGFYCPCHGSHYDNVGRARKGPAPLNLEVPPYKFLSDTLVVVG